MKLPKELGELPNDDGSISALVETIVRDCAKVCMEMDDLSEWGESAAACERAILFRYGLEDK